MGTRSTIEIRSGGSKWKIYRHWDSYPTCVLADLKILLERSTRGLEDPEYMLANFIFYAKLTTFLRNKGDISFAYRSWELSYGVCSDDHEHGDLEYEYIIDADNEKYKKRCCFLVLIKLYYIIFGTSIPKAFTFSIY